MKIIHVPPFIIATLALLILPAISWSTTTPQAPVSVTVAAEVVDADAASPFIDFYALDALTFAEATGLEPATEHIVFEPLVLVVDAPTRVVVTIEEDLCRPAWREGTPCETVTFAPTVIHVTITAAATRTAGR